MEKYLIKIDDFYYVAEGNKEGELLISSKKQDAAIMEGTINLNSHWQRIYKAMRYGYIKPKNISILTI